MGRVLRREHEGKRLVFAALLTTGMMALLLALAALAAPSSAYAGEMQGSGTADDPVLIHNTEELVAWCNKLNTMGKDYERQQHARLMNDLTSPGPDGTEYGGAIDNSIIGSMKHPDLQVAEFDGNGHLIELKLEGYSALFQTGGQPGVGRTGVTTIKDLHIIGSVNYGFSDGSSVGTLFASIGKEGDSSEDRRVEITDCTNQANVQGSSSAGGFIGSYYDTINGEGTIHIERCSNFGEIQSSNGHAGGLVGSLVEYSSTIATSDHKSCLEYCSNNGTVRSMGGTFSTFDDVNNEDKPKTIGGSAGGLVGYLAYKSSYVIIGNDYNQGEVYSASDIGYSGGLVGFADTSLANRVVSACYNIGAIKTDAKEAGHAGGLFGYAWSRALEIKGCETLEGSVPADAISGSTCNGEIVRRISLDYTHGYTDNDSDMCLDNGYQVLEGVGVGRNVKVALINPMNSQHASDAYDHTYWNTVFSSSNADAPSGYRLAYWTREAPDANGTWSKPPKEYKADPNDIHDRIYGGEPVFYAYCEPSSATVKFDLNEPAGGYKCSLDPKDVTKTYVKGEPVGALPTATCVSNSNKNDTRAFLGWATKPDGSDPQAEWISANSDNLYHYVKSREVTLYAQWANTSLPFDIYVQPENCVASALAEVVNQRIDFGFSTTYPFDDAHRYSVQLQYREDSDEDYKEVSDLLPSNYNNRVYFTLDSVDQTKGDYRLKIDYYELDNLMGSLYTSSANIVLQIPQVKADLSYIKLSKDDIHGNNSGTDEIMGTKAYDLFGDIMGDLPLLLGDTPSPEDELEPNNYAYNVWIEGGSIVPSKQYVADKGSFWLAGQHLKEGQTYQLCVARVFHRPDVGGTYKGESEPYCIPFEVPYADTMPASITTAKMSGDDVVTPDEKPCSFESHTGIALNGEFNLVADLKYDQPQPEGAVVHAQWQYCKFGKGGWGWTGVPENLIEGSPYYIAWSDDRKTARVYTTLRAYEKLDECYFRVKVSTPTSLTNAISDETSELSVYLPTPKITQEPTVTNDTQMNLAWEWRDGEGKPMDTGGFTVVIERQEPGAESWDEEKTAWTKDESYQISLDPQRKYRVCVRAETASLKGDFTSHYEFKTAGQTGLTWDDSYCTAYLPSEQKNDKISVDYDWADYNDGNHAAEYVWYLSKDTEGGYDTFEPFAITDSDSMNFPDDFKVDNAWDPSEAKWVSVEARVWFLDRWGDRDYIIEDTKRWTPALPVIHNTTEPRNLEVKDIGSHSATVCWDAPDEGMVREYEVRAGGHTLIIPAVKGQTSYQATFSDLWADTSYYVSVSTIDSRKKDSTIATATYGEIRTLFSPEVGTWAATADKTAAAIGEEITLSARYEADSGEFSTGAQLQWYSWREGEKDWKPEGDPVPLGDAGKDYTTTLKHTVNSGDYGRQWKLGVKATSPDEAVTGSSNVVTVSITPATPTGVACETPTPTSIPVSWMPVVDAEGYQVKCAKLDADGKPVNATTYTVAANSLTPGADGKLCYEVSGLEPSTTYQVSIAAFVHGVTGEFSAALNATTLAVPTIQTPEFQQVPKTAWVEAGADATFTAQASVSDGGAISYTWQRKGAGEQNFAPLAQSDKYVMSEDAGVATLTVKHVGADDVAATFRCVATNSKDNQTANAASPAAYLTVTPVAPTDAKAWATSATTGEVTWTANGEVRRFEVMWQQLYGNGKTGPEYSKVVTIPDDTTQGSCQLDGLAPNSGYYVEIKAAPQGGFIGKNEEAYTSFSTPHASALNAATVSSDKTLAKPGEEVTFKVETNVDGQLSEKLEYRWQHNSFGETWIDVEGEAGVNKELSVTAPEGGSIDSYRCIVTSTRTTASVGSDTKSVTSSTGLLLTNVPVAQPTQLAAEPGTTSAHLTWANNDARDVTYQVQYAEGPTPNVDAWQTVNNVGSSTSCDVEGLKANAVYSWRVQAVVRDQLYSDWAQADTFTTLEEPSALATVVVTPRQGVAVAGSNKGVTYTAVTNIDNALNGESLSYQWQESATGETWSDVQGATTASFVANTSDTKPRSCQYRCVVTASKDGAALKAIISDAVSFMTTAVPPTSLVANKITAASADLSWEGSLVEGLSYRVLWRVSGADAWTSTPDLTKAAYTLKSLMPATTYEWYVQVMDNGQVSARSATSLFVTQSLSPVPQLTRVVVGPVDQTPSAGERAKLTAYTNVDDVADATMTYKWEIRKLDSDPTNPDAWRTLEGKTTREIELGVATDGYVRCTVTYTPPTSVLAMSLDNPSVTSTNEARVRVMPGVPSELTFDNLDKNAVDIHWTSGAGAETHDLVYRMLGSSEWTIVQELGYSDTTLDKLEPGTTYEWSVRSVAFSASGDPLCSDWVAGPPFTTLPEDIVFSRAEVTPSATSVMAGADRTIALTATTNADADHEHLTYQWQHFNGSAWDPIENATAATLQVSAKDLTVGEHAYRCEVTATREGVKPKTLTSNESVVTVKPAAPTDLSVNDIQLVNPDMPSGQVQAMLSWKLGNAALPEGATFEVSYRKLAGDGAIRDGWTSKGLTVDNKNMTCQAILEATDITYQWRVRVVQNGVTSPWSAIDTFITAVDQPAEKLTSVLVTPSDSLVSNEDVVLTASTNVDDDSALTYQWQWCELATVDPRTAKEEDWTTIDSATSKTVKLSGDDRNRFVRCTVTQVVDGKKKTVASNPACVRTEPIAPYDTFSMLGTSGGSTSGGITLGWKCKDVRADKSQTNVIGYEVNYRKVGTSEWIEKICATRNCELWSSVLEPDATYEWRVRTILSGDVGQKDLTKGGPHSDWVDGPVFTSPKVEVTPARAAAVIGSGRTLTFTPTLNDVITNDRRNRTYQWQRYNGTKWEPVSGAISETFSIVANDATTAGTSRYRCVVTIQDSNIYNNVNVTSNEVTCTLAPAAPANLVASDITSGEATLAWKWVQGGLQAADEFKVLYRESGAKVWETATVAGDIREFALEGLKPETIYEWRVQAAQNGVESLPSSSNLFVTASEHPALKLESVLVDPSDQAVAPGAQATVKVTTNLDGMVDPGELTYKWEKRALDSDPNASDAWKVIEDEKGSSVTSSVITSGFVRCTVTYTVNGSVVGTPVVSNQASVRVLPADAPTGLNVQDVGNTEAKLAWDDTLPTNGSFTLVYRAAGTEAWTTVPKLTVSPYTAQDLAPGTTYEWRMRSESADGLTSEWVDGPRFTTTAQDAVLGEVEVAPQRVDAVAGDSTLVSEFFATVDGTAEGQSLAYQWQVKRPDGWTNLPGETGERTHLSVANLEAGEYSLRCVVTATAPGGTSKTVESNQVALVLSPATPSGLDVLDVTRDTATLAWTWAGPGTADSFNVRYHEEGASNADWVSVPAGSVDPVNMTCTIEGLAPGTSYEWLVQAVQGNQTSSWAAGGFVTQSGGSLKVARIWPPDVVVSAGEQATFTAFTNLGNAEDISYEWQHRALDSEDVDASWQTIPNATGRVLTLAANTTGYVRCVATQAAPSTGAAVASNQARVRVEPGAPSGLAVGEVGETHAVLSWAPADVDGTAYTLAYRAHGSQDWTEVTGLAEPSYDLAGLAPETIYEWRVQAVVGAGEDALVTDWIDGPNFTTAVHESELASVTATPRDAAAIAGCGRTVTFAALTNVDDVAGETLTFQWQVDRSGTWTDLSGATGRALDVTADASREAGTHGFRCVVTAMPAGGGQKIVASNEVTLTLAPPAPVLDKVEAGTDAATLAWTWAGPGAVDSFNVAYREAGTEEWQSVDAAIDAVNKTCALTGLAPETAYEWRVQAVQNGVKSLWSPVGSFATLSDDPAPVLKRVVTAPLDQTVAVGGQATLTAYTNLGDNADVTYAWELRALDSTPDAWVTIDGATARSVTLPMGASGYVRCTATYAPEGGELQTVISNQARVRVEPGVPSGLAVGEVGETHAVLSWAPADVDGTAYTLAYRAHGSQDWTEVTGLAEPSYDLAGLAPETIYEWRVQAVVGAGEDALVTDWIDGPSFTTLAPPEPQEYHVTAGANGTWKPGQPGLAFTIDAPRDKFLSLAVDGVELVQGTDYTVGEGSTVVMLSPDYLANLAEGKHNLAATFSDGAASTAFTVAPADPGPTPNPPGPTPPDPTPTPNPSDPTPAPAPDSGGKALAPTGDPLGAALPLVGVLAVASVCAAIAAFAHKRRPVLKRNRRF